MVIQNVRHWTWRLGLTCVAQAIIFTMISARCTVSNGAVEPTEPRPPPTVAVEPTVDTRTQIWYGSYLETATSRNPERAIIDQFEVTHPNIRISRWPATDFSPHTAISYLRQDPSFTVVLTVWADQELSLAIDEGLCLDLSHTMSDTDLDRSYPDAFLALGEREGKLYYLPAFYSWFAIYYNKQIFDRYNLEPPETWLEFLELSQVLLENGVAPLIDGGGGTGSATTWFDYLNMRLNGPEFHAALMQGEERYDDPRVSDVFETWSFLVDSGYVAEETLTLAFIQGRSLFLNGEAAMMLMNSASAPDRPDEFGFFRFPIMDPTLAVSEIAPTLGYIVPAEVINPVEATEFLAYLGSPDTQTMLTQGFAVDAGFLPVNQEVDPKTFTGEMKQGLDLVQAADYIGQPYSANFDSRLTRPLWRIFFNIMRGEGYDDDLIKLEEERQRWFD